LHNCLATGETIDFVFGAEILGTLFPEFPNDPDKDGVGEKVVEKVVEKFGEKFGENP
jgi:hypothetical protein